MCVKESEGAISALAVKLPIVSPGKMKMSRRKNQVVVKLLNMSTQRQPWSSMFIKLVGKRENQGGGIGRHTAPPRTTRTDRKSNGKEVRHQGNKK